MQCELLKGEGVQVDNFSYQCHTFPFPGPPGQCKCSCL